MHVVTIVGARPQFIKAAMVSKAVRESAEIRETLVHTGQHYDANMSAIFFSELQMPEPAYNLGVGSGPHGLQTARQLIELEKLLLELRPDVVLVYGDTNSTLAGALAAAKLDLPLAHVEAGLRSFRRDMPEEVNRVLTDHCSTLLFAPTDLAVANLEREGITGDAVHLVGDVMFDAALEFGPRARAGSRVLADHHLQPREFALATIHRPANTDDPRRLRAIQDGLMQVARHCPVLFPVHPRTRSALRQLGRTAAPTGGADLIMTEPFGYFDMVALESQTAVVVTDSGGLQKEAFFHRTPCVTLREETEWQELVDAGWNRLCPPTSPEAVSSAVLAAVGTSGQDVHPYGFGDASQKIAVILAAHERSQGPRRPGRFQRTKERANGIEEAH